MFGSGCGGNSWRKIACLQQALPRKEGHRARKRLPRRYPLIPIADPATTVMGDDGKERKEEEANGQVERLGHKSRTARSTRDEGFV